MILITIIIFICALLYLVSSTIFYFVLNNLVEEKCDDTNYSNISIIIAARNEEKNLDRLFESLLRIDYPKDKFEIILVNDHSTDDTLKKATKLAASVDNVTVINAEEVEGLKAKRAALATGIKKTGFDNIVITDADCYVGPYWLKCYSEAFNKYDFIIGIAPLKHRGELAGRLSSFENLKSQLLVFVLTKLGLAYSASARNFGFKKSAFNKIGGYSTTTQSLSGDDDLLLREAVKNKLRIGLLNSPRSMVYSDAKETFKEYFNQKARHTSTSHHYLASRKIALAFWHLLNLVVLISFILSFYNSIFVLPVLIKLIIDYIITNNFQNSFGYNFNPVEIILLSIIYELFIPVHYFNSFRFGNRWS